MPRDLTFELIANKNPDAPGFARGGMNYGFDDVHNNDQYDERYNDQYDDQYDDR